MREPWNCSRRLQVLLKIITVWVTHYVITVLDSSLAHYLSTWDDLWITKFCVLIPFASSPMLHSKYAVLQRGRPPQLGPTVGSGVQGETVALVAQLHQRQNALQIGNNRITSLLPYQGYTITQ